jgi:hypothetical protein
MTAVLARCHCRAIVLELTLPTTMCSHCHCETCRRVHGAAFVTWTAVPRERFRFIEGEARLSTYTTSGRARET